MDPAHAVPVLTDSVPEPVAPAETPEETPTETPSPEETPKSTDEAQATPAAPEESLFELPDGRKVDAAGLKAEYEKLLPEFTRRSQRLAEYEKTPAVKTEIKNDKDVPPWQNPDYEPQSWQEVFELSKRAALEEINSQARAEKEMREAVAAEVDKQLSEIKAKDSSLDESSLFQHATKFGFRDLRLAHENMLLVRAAAKEAEDRVVRGRTKVDPVATPSTPAPAENNGVDPTITGKFRSAQEYFQSLKR